MKPLKSIVSTPATILTAFAFLAFATSAAHAETVLPSDNGFETPDLGSGGSAYEYNVPGTSWNFGGESGIAANGSDFNVVGATNGNQDGMMATSTSGQAGFIQNGDGSGGSDGSFIEQDITLPAGPLSVSFDLESRDSDSAAAPDQIQVVLYDNGTYTGLGTYTPDSDTSFNLQTTDIPYDAVGGADQLFFVGSPVDSTNVNSASFIDNVQINVAPEPQTLAFLACGGLLLLVLSRFLKTKADLL
jgi:hypothetical protein